MIRLGDKFQHSPGLPVSVIEAVRMREFLWLLSEDGFCGVLNTKTGERLLE